MGVEQYSLVANDWLNLEAIINDLTQRVVGQELHPTSDPTFVDLTLTGNMTIAGDLSVTGDLTLDSVTDTHVLYSNANVLAGNAAFTFNDSTGVVTITGIGGNGLTGYDLKIGDTSTPDYGLIQTGDAAFGRVPYNAMNMDLDGSVIIRNLTAPATSNIEFAFLESGGTSIRFALAKSAVGNATYNPRSMLIAGPAVWDDEIVTVGYWQGQGIFDNLVCDTTGGDGADLGVQNDLEVEGDIFTDSIKESTSAAGTTFANSIIASSLTASRLMNSNGSKVLSSVSDLTAWIAGTANQITVTDDSDGTVTLSTPQDIHAAATNFTVAGLTVTSATFMTTNSVVFQPSSDSTTFLSVLDNATGSFIFNVDSTNKRVGLGTNAPNQRLTLGGSTLQWISRSVDTSGLVLAGGTGVTGGGYFQVTGNSNTTSPGLGSAEFVIRNNAGANDAQRSKFAIVSYDGGSSFVQRFRVYGNTGEMLASTFRFTIGDDISVGGSKTRLVVAKDDNDCYINLGQSSSNTFEFGWNYNGTPANAHGHIVTFGYNNDLKIDVKNLILQSDSGNNIGINEPAPETIVETTHTAPYFTYHNSTHEDSDGGRESRLIFKGEQSGGEETELAVLEVSHDGTGDDQLGKVVLGANTGSGVVDALAIMSTSDWVINKTSGVGIKVDLAAPTFGFADILGDQFSKNTGATKPTLTAYNGAVFGWQFADGDEAYISYHIPHDYVPGTDIHLHIHWSQNAAGATGGTVDFKYFAIYSKGHNQASGSVFTSTPITATFSSIDINDGGAGLTQYQQHLTEVTISAATATAALFDRDDFEPDGVIELTLEMDANNMTGTPSDPFIHFADIHYQTTGVFGTKSRTPNFYT